MGAGIGRMNEADPGDGLPNVITELPLVGKSGTGRYPAEWPEVCPVLRVAPREHRVLVSF